MSVDTNCFGNDAVVWHLQTTKQVQCETVIQDEFRTSASSRAAGIFQTARLFPFPLASVLDVRAMVLPIRASRLLMRNGRSKRNW